MPIDDHDETDVGWLIEIDEVENDDAAVITVTDEMQLHIEVDDDEYEHVLDILIDDEDVDANEYL